MDPSLTLRPLDARPLDAQPLAERTMSLTLFKYLVRDTLFSFTVSFLFFFAIFFVNQLLLMAQQVLAKQVPFYQVALLVFYAIPQIIALSAPFASLMGTLMTVGRLNTDNEILIMLSAGLSHRMIFVPALVVGLAISIASFLANDILLPMGTIQYARLYRRILLSTPALELEPNSIKRFRDTIIITGPVEGRAIENVVIIDRTGDGERRVILAQNAELMDGGREGLSLDLSGAFMQSAREMIRNDYDYAFVDFLRYWVPQEDLMQAISAISPNQMSSRDLRREVREQGEDLLERLNNKYYLYYSSAMYLEDSLRRGPPHHAWNQRESNLESFTSEAREIVEMNRERGIILHQLEFHKKFSIPFGALSFVLLAVSLGLLAKKSGQTVGFILGVIISFIFWVMLMVGQTVSIRTGYSPFLAIWMPNLVAFAVGVLLFIKRILR